MAKLPLSTKWLQVRILPLQMLFKNFALTNLIDAGSKIKLSTIKDGISWLPLWPSLFAGFGIHRCVCDIKLLLWIEPVRFSTNPSDSGDYKVVPQVRDWFFCL